MEQYIQELHNTLAASPVGRSASSSFENVAVDTVAQLNALGYTAYNVNPQNVEEVEAALNTDLEQAGLPTDDSYIILIEGEDEEDTQGAISPHMDIKTSDEFKYTYNGKMYRMRWMTVYPNEYGGDSTMTVTTDDIIFFGKNVLTAATVTNTLGKVISVSGRKAGVPQVVTIGSILSIFSSLVEKGIKAVPENSKLSGMASSTWIRRYTQVFDNNRSIWLNRCFVEEVNTNLSVMSFFWNVEKKNNDTNSKKFENTLYSSKRNDKTWRKTAAAQAHEIDNIKKDEFPTVYYEYGKTEEDKKVVCTHSRKLPS